MYVKNLLKKYISKCVDLYLSSNKGSVYINFFKRKINWHGIIYIEKWRKVFYFLHVKNDSCDCNSLLFWWSWSVLVNIGLTGRCVTSFFWFSYNIWCIYILRNKIKASENCAIGACYFNTYKYTALLHKYQFYH